MGESRIERTANFMKEHADEAHEFVDKMIDIVLDPELDTNKNLDQEAENADERLDPLFIAGVHMAITTMADRGMILEDIDDPGFGEDNDEEPEDSEDIEEDEEYDEDSGKDS